MITANFMGRFLIGSAVLVAAIPLTSKPANALSIVNSSFETVESIDGFPSTFGDWGIDASTIVEAENGITPLDGSKMLRFGRTAPSSFGSGANGLDSGVGQLVDISSILSEVRSGSAVVELSSFFNRIPGDAQTDTSFGVLIRSFTGSPSSFPARPQSWTSQALERFSSDSDVGTWESLTAELLLPINTEFIQIAVLGFEDVFNDAPPFEFDGHYADQVFLGLKGSTPAPTPVPTPALLPGLIGFGMSVVRKKRKLEAN